MQPLPIDTFLPQVITHLKTARCLVLVAEPGAGKTTRVPPAIIRSGLLTSPNPRLIMLQPRRVAARASAARIAFENAWTLGHEVGYQVRGEKRLTPETPLQILTEGILTRKLIADPFLEGIGAVILDEFHERHLDSDLALAMVREIATTVRDDLLLLVMSATLDAQAVSAYLGNCPILQVPGRLFPVSTRFAPPPTTPTKLHLSHNIATQVRAVLNDEATDPGDLLIFLPGIEEIRRTAAALEPLATAHDLAILPLHGSLPFDAQARVLDPLPQRKVILATNIAETSLTIDGVRTVIDSGLARIPSYDARRGMDRLELKRISRASATQRTGRAGRTAPGQCIRLWSQAEDRNLHPFQPPEIHRLDLASPLLHLYQWSSADPATFPFFDAPPAHAIASAQRTLLMLGAIARSPSSQSTISNQHSFSITPLGRQLLRIPAHPRLARLMLAAAEQNLLQPAATIAALMSEKDILLTSTDLSQRRTRDTQGRSDLLHRLHLLEVAEQSHFARSLKDQGIDPSAARQVARTRDDLLRQARHLKTAGHSHTPTEDDLLKLILLAYPDRLCRRRESNPDTATMVGGFGIRIDPASIVVQAPLFIAIDARDDTRHRTREAISRILSEVEEPWLEGLFPHLISEFREVDFDQSTGRLTARILTRFDDLPIRQRTDHHANPDDLAAALATLARQQASAIFAADPAAAQVLQRLAFLRKHIPEKPWPAFDDAQLGEILARSTHGKRSLQQLKEQDLSELLLSEMDYQQRRLLDDLAPTHLTVPSGSRIRLEYDGEKQPTLAVRLQEVFSWLQTPRIAGNRVPLLLHLLGPNYRPVQITSDLASFWNTTYFQVRKDLRIRYPKHSWPEDPLTAKPEAKGRPRQR